ncbi:NDP-hexose 2,3-dehydratase family protein [Lysinibacillus sp. SGAir0095]|uniref:NDP-hexose 2,3-dehydratase family protein n=1 Tax=Lysinibacillus sp. SGAir0095 TaxID=2070463 RepID=UPI0010CD3004|nr:NDP-hexose 2,3-dehydratase family protein [Lysinibacillus sp. SGAir0095]QCR31503.1 hypothetical protein C1N55_04675 [Lysinibacillus sp. SGAir0095]
MENYNIPLFALNDKRDFLKLLQNKRNETKAKINLIPFDCVEYWKFDEIEGNLKHETNGFFKIQSLISQNEENPIQLIINQPEHGILGLIITEVNQVLYCLVQMKIEPGNKDIIQISPTVQATESNYKRVHKGKKVKYIDYFLNGTSQMVYKQLQSEQGAKFFEKRNWNIIVEIDSANIKSESENHYWLSLSLIIDLLKEDNIINMDLRSIISCLKLPKKYKLEHSKNESWSKSYFSNSYNNENYQVIKNNLNKKKARPKKTELSSLNVALQNNWYYDNYSIYSNHNKEFCVKFIEVTIQNREISSWSQPIVADNIEKLNCFIIKKIDGIYHYLIQYCNEIGITSSAEIGPTLHNVPVKNLPNFFTDLIASGKEIFSSKLSEEGGRFYQMENKYVIIEIPEEIEIELPDSHDWATLYTLKKLLEESSNVNIEARSLLSTFNWREIGYEEN